MKIFLLLLCINFWQLIFSQTIQGKLDNLTEGKIYFYYSYNGIYRHADTVQAKPDGTFSKTFKFSGIGNVTLYTGEVGYDITLFPESIITVTADAASYKKFNKSFRITGPGSEFNNMHILSASERIKEFDWDYGLPADSFVLNLTGWRTVRDSLRKAIVTQKLKGVLTKNALQYLRVDSINDLYWTVGALRDYHNVSLKRTSETDSFFQSNISPHLFSTDDEDFLSAAQYRNFWDRYITNKFDWKRNSADSAEVTQQNWMAFRFEETKKIVKGKLQIAVLADLVQNNFAYNYKYLPENLFSLYDSILEKYGREIPDPEVLSDAQRSISAIKETRIRTSKGNIAPAFALFDSQGKMHELKNYKGKVIYLDVWASWCSPCIEELPDYKKLISKFKDRKDLIFISVSIDNDKNVWIVKGLEKHQPPGIQLWAGKGGWKSEFARNYFITGIPQYILIDRKGKIINFNAGRPGSGDNIENEIKSVLKE